MNKTIPCISISLLIAILITLPAISYWSGLGWGIENMAVISWLSTGMHYMDVFFHEIGHSLFHWFYGQPSFPSFDFQHGGGMAYAWDQKLFLVFLMHGLFLLGLFYFKEEISVQILIGLTALFHLATVYTDFHETISIFMGHGTAIAIGGFFLYRAWFDLAPRGTFERYLNGIVGFGIIFNNMVLFGGLMKSEAIRDHYSQQKGGHGFGDLSRVADVVADSNITPVAIFALIYAIILLIIPAILYLFSDQRLIDKYGDNLEETL